MAGRGQENTMQTAVQGVATLIQRIQAEYREMPGLNLTLAQAQRVWSLDRTDCAAILDALVQAHFLTQTRSGTFVRVG
jgi:hypothetical protein